MERVGYRGFMSDWRHATEIRTPKPSGGYTAITVLDDVSLAADVSSTIAINASAYQVTERSVEVNTVDHQSWTTITVVPAVTP